MNAVLREPSSGQPSMSLIIVDSSDGEVQNVPQGNVNLQGEKPLDLRVYSDKGEYIVKLIDDNGKNYAQTYMKVVSVDVNYNGFSPQKRSKYLFDFKRDGQKISVSDVGVTVDGGKYGTYRFTNVQNIEVDVGQYTGEIGRAHV